MVLTRLVRTVLIAATVLFGTQAFAAEPLKDRSMYSVFGGRMTNNSWIDSVVPGESELTNTWVVGVSVAREWPLWEIGYIGVEAQLLRHWGGQDHWEIAAPVYLRSRRPESVYLPSLAYGLGWSYASKVPAIEVERTGESQKLLAYWFMELEFGGKEPKLTPFIRLHHRSDAFGLFPTDTGSNAILFGLRKSF